MEHTLCLAVLAMTLATAFAGYSFPVEAENQATATFKTDNRGMVIDETNYLVDLSGRYSLCLISTRQQSGELTIKETTPEGRHIDGLSDYVEGPNTDSDSLTAYIDGALKRWVREEPFRSTITKHNRYGCSVEPGCGRYAVIVCLFSTV